MLPAMVILGTRHWKFSAEESERLSYPLGSEREYVSAAVSLSRDIQKPFHSVYNVHIHCHLILSVSNLPHFIRASYLQ